ncbi:PREDICTED: uncharacterized protein LOC109328960 [Lupinus angustifolius]|uniref:uncharacterized protein LOC109328960 n=1 Tax=Lupinus angustifolius TaxID=3871 RepID=UPI00092ED14A|nr:PREDICTED: uncharacterized protein LOC109328960 [Lupinus angustifolius]
MSSVRSNLISFFFIFFLLITTTPFPSHSFSFSPYFLYKNLFPLSQSLLTGVSNLRASRGDVAGAARARAIADKLERGPGFGFWRLLWSAIWNWKNFTVMELYDIVSDMNNLLKNLNELTHLKSVAERSRWIRRNYQDVLNLFKSISHKLLKAFGNSGVVREVVETVQIEVVEGGLLRDCLELGSSDLKALIQVAQNLVLQFFPDSNKDPEL